MIDFNWIFGLASVQLDDWTIGRRQADEKWEWQNAAGIVQRKEYV